MSFFDSNCTVGLHVKQHLFLKMSFQRAGKTLFLSHLAFQPNLKVVMSAKVCIISSGGRGHLQALFAGPKQTHLGPNQIEYKHFQLIFLG